MMGGRKRKGREGVHSVVNRFLLFFVFGIATVLDCTVPYTELRTR
jgi:hypothetical protein